MSSTTIPPAAVAANNNTLNSALAAEQISSPASPVGKPVDEKKQLEEGEIEENPSESDSQTKTIFDDASKFNVKVWAYNTRVLQDSVTDIRFSTPCFPLGLFTSTPLNQNLSLKPLRLPPLCLKGPMAGWRIFGRLYRSTV